MKKVGSSILLGLTAALIAAPINAQSTPRPEYQTAIAGFGNTLAIVDNLVLVGEPANQARPGIVYVYAKSGGQWTEVSQLTASNADLADGFGTALSPAGDHLLISSTSGVYHFHRSGDTWRELGMVTAAGAIPSDGFGSAIAASGNYALIGAPGANEGTGSVYLFQFSGGDWNEVAKVDAPAAEGPQVFGATLAFDGELAVVGAPLRNARTGGVFVYRVGMNSLDFAGAIEADDVGNNAQFGSVVWTGMGMVAASAPNAQQGRGTVRMFRETEGEWAESARVSAFDPTPRSGFGSSMAMTDNALMIGASGANGSGVVYHFDMVGGELTGSNKIMAPEGMGGRASFGGSMAASGNLVAVAATGANGRAGQVVVYDNGLASMASATLESAPDGWESISGGEIRCEDGNASAWDCSEVDLVSFVSVADLGGQRGISTNDNWGWTDPDSGKEYALVGMTDRASFVDISDPFNPRVVGILMMPEGARPSAWRDIKTYKNHAYIVSDNAGDHGVQVFDLTKLRDHTSGDMVTFEDDANYKGISSAHNIVINEESGFAYSVGSSSGGESCGGGLHMIDIRDPKNPTFAGCFSDPQTGRASTGYSHDAQCVMYRGPDSDYEGAEICLGANETALSIADVSDKSNPVAISRAAYPNPGYTHQGWLTDDHRFFFMNDELDELNGTADHTRTIIWDISDLDDPQLVAEHMGTQESSDHNLYITGNLMYQSNYKSGLRILDVTDPANPVEVAYFDTVAAGDNSAGMGGSWSNYPFFESGMVIVTSGSEGLFVVRPTVRRTVFE